MAPRLQKGVEMDNLGNEAEARDLESLQELPRGLTWTKNWTMRVRKFMQTRITVRYLLTANRVIEQVLVSALQALEVLSRTGRSSGLPDVSIFAF
jgi:hypothetical protein